MTEGALWVAGRPGRPRAGAAGRPWAEALCWSAALSALFVLVYGGCNALASGREGLPSLYAEWELGIPFVPALVVPYMSIDLFFVASFLLFGDRGALRAHGRRLLAAILTAGTVFALVPLRAAWPRPHVDGWPAPLFELLWAFDRPHNLAPSLHVALGLLLWHAYARRARGALRRLVDAWFALILVSPLLTWQHHLLDVATGLALGVVCLYAVQDPAGPDARGPARRNPVAARWYAAGAAAYAAFAVALVPWGLLLMWPAAALGVLAGAYAGAGAGVFRKSGGRLSAPARVLLSPYLAGAWASYFVYRRQAPAFVEVSPGLYVGRRLLPGEARRLVGLGVRGVLDLTAEYSETPRMLGLEYRNVRVVDRTAPTPAQLAECADFVGRALTRGGVYVHCALGYSRAPCAVAAYLIASGAAASVEEAVASVRAARPQAVITPALVEALERFAAGGK